uniref:Uncharacterized protein n=1 Tax=Cacopsylla melanoneura TaxID=428564 RepID=A0A8D9BEF8_9HEMI
MALVLPLLLFFFSCLLFFLFSSSFLLSSHLLPFQFSPLVQSHSPLSGELTTSSQNFISAHTASKLFFISQICFSFSYSTSSSPSSSSSFTMVIHTYITYTSIV